MAVRTMTASFLASLIVLMPARCAGANEISSERRLGLVIAVR